MAKSESISSSKFQLATSSSADSASSIRNSEATRWVPKVSRPLLRWFAWYSRRYVRRHFHSLRVSLKGMPPETGELPLVIYCNHASWWDALVGLVLTQQFFPGRTAFAPIEAAMLARYKFFRRLGFFGLEQHSRRGAVEFLRTAEAVLRSPRSLLAITPQGRFVDVRERPICFKSGLGHLATRVQRALFVPFAAEYLFWEERLPEILVRFGEPVAIQTRPAFDSRDWTKLFEEKLTDAQGALAAEAQRRNPADFRVVMRGGSGQGGVYDLWRSLQSNWRGETFRKEHGEK